MGRCRSSVPTQERHSGSPLGSGTLAVPLLLLLTGAALMSVKRLPGSDDIRLRENCNFCKFAIDGDLPFGYSDHVRFGLFSVPAPLLRFLRTAGFFSPTASFACCFL